jgi:hypothetical protein
MFRRIAVLASISVMGIMAFGSASANAALGDVVVCQFEGLSGVLNPNLPPILGDLVPSIENGNYNYGGEATCTGRDATSGTIEVGTTPNARIDSAGEYSNLYCGTGLASDVTGDGTVINFNNPAVADVPGVPYTVAFVGGTGPLVIGAGSKVTGAPSVTANAEAAYVGAGLVNIVPEGLANGGPPNPPNPSAPDNCVTGGVAQFVVNGGLIALGTGSNVSTGVIEVP